MSRYFRLIRLKMTDLFNRPLMLVILFVLPIVLGLFAGISNQNNRRADMVLAVVDEDLSQASRTLVETLKLNGWTVTLESASSAERLVLRHSVDGILHIQPGFDVNLAVVQKPFLKYSPAEGSLVTTVIQEAIAAAILPEYSRRSITAQLIRIYGSQALPVPEGLTARVSEQIRSSLAAEKLLQVDYVGNLALTPTLTFVVSDHSLEVFFLSIYAVLGSLALSGLPMKRRLAATRHGLALDFLTTQASLLLLGIGQILLYSGSMYSQMPGQVRMPDLYSLTVYLVLMLGLSQLLILLEERIRLFISLMVLILLSVAGGCFFALSTAILNRVGQYTPHGWVLSRIQGMPVLPVPVVLLLAAAAMLTGFLVSSSRIHRAASA